MFPNHAILIHYLLLISKTNAHISAQLSSPLLFPASGEVAVAFFFLQQQRTRLPTTQARTLEMLNTKHEPRRHGDIFKCNDNPCMPLVSGLQNVGGRTLHARLLFNVFNIPNHCTLDSLTKVLCFLLKMTLFYLSNFISCQRDTYNKRKSRFVFFFQKKGLVSGAVPFAILITGRTLTSILFLHEHSLPCPSIHESPLFL